MRKRNVAENPHIARIAVSAYARLRGIDQKTMRVTLAKIGWQGKVDPVAVDKLIEDAKDIRYKPGLTTKGALVSFAEAQRRERLAKAIQQEMKVRKIRGTLVDRAAVDKMAFECAREVRDRMRSIADRLSGILAAESNQAEVFRIISEEIQQSLQGLITEKASS